jgi:hypothetical protein
MALWAAAPRWTNHWHLPEIKQKRTGGHIVLLTLQDVRNGPGALLAECLKKMTSFGELNTTLVMFALVY